MGDLQDRGSGEGLSEALALPTENSLAEGSLLPIQLGAPLSRIHLQILRTVKVSEMNVGTAGQCSERTTALRSGPMPWTGPFPSMDLFSHRDFERVWWDLHSRTLHSESVPLFLILFSPWIPPRDTLHRRPQHLSETHATAAAAAKSRAAGLCRAALAWPPHLACSSSQLPRSHLSACTASTSSPTATRKMQGKCLPMSNHGW